MRADFHGELKIINVRDLGTAHGFPTRVEPDFRSKLKTILTKYDKDKSYEDYIVTFVTNYQQVVERVYLSRIDVDHLPETSEDGVSVYVSTVERVIKSLGEAE